MSSGKPADEGSSGEAESPTPKAEPETPTPEAEPEAPTPEAEPEAPTPEAEAEAPTPEAEAEAPTPEAEPETPTPEAEPEAPTPQTEGSRSELPEGPAPVAEAPPPKTEPEAAAAAPAASPASSADKERKGSLRERIAADREAERLRRAEFLSGRVAKVLVGLLLLLAAAWFWRAPLLRQLAQRDLGDLQTWALNWLCELEDPGSFELFMAGLAKEERTELFTTLIFRVAGREHAPREGKPRPPADPDAVAAHGTTILDFLQSPDAGRRRAGLRAMVALREREWVASPERVAAVGALLDPGQDPVTRRFAALVLRGVGVPEHLRKRVLNAALEDSDRQVRRFAVQALAASGDEGVVERLRLGLRDPAPEVKREVYLALTQLGAEVALGDLVDIYEESPMHRDVVLDVLGARQGPEVMQLLARGVGDPSASTRMAAVEALAARPGEDVRHLLVDALEDGNAAVRLAAIDALASRPDATRSLGPLVEALSHHEGWEELRRLHRALSRAASDAQIPTPIQRVKSSWVKAIDGWRRYLEAQQR